jgi:hypothetical protein
LTPEFLKILELLSFDEGLFRKEFIKTLYWVPREDYPIIDKWMSIHHYTTKYPDLRRLLTEAA